MLNLPAEESSFKKNSFTVASLELFENLRESQQNKNVENHHSFEKIQSNQNSDTEEKKNLHFQRQRQRQRESLELRTPNVSVSEREKVKLKVKEKMGFVQFLRVQFFFLVLV